MSQIETFARAEQATPFMVLLAGFNILLQACSGQSDLVVGCPMAGRIRSEYESLVGMFSYPVLMRTKMAGCHDVRGLLQRVRKVVLEAAEHGDVPFAKVTDCLGSQPASLVRAMFSYVSRLRNLRFEGLQCSRRPTDRGVTDLDLFMTIYPDRDEWHGVLEYNTDLFEAPTIRSLVAAYIDVLQAALAEPDLSVVGLATRARVKPPARLTVAATFTADPLLEVLSFWSAELDIPLTPVIAPYNQLFQQLMDPQSQVLSPGGALNVLLVRPEDWVRCVGSDLDKQTRLLARSTLDFIAAVHNATPRMSCPLKIYLCPPSPGLATDIALAVAAAEQEIREAFAPIDTIQILSAEVCAEMYSAAEIHDRQADRAAHIPYTLEFYAAVGTQIIRQLRMQTSRSSKVLVLDCDNTLWQGLCAENGPHGVVITEGHRALQRFVLQQAATGVLICLASKNVPEEVFQVFRTNPAMILQESDITAFRINWEPKSSNLVSLAAELRLALDSFVFLDDDPRECAEVSARCPQVLSLRLPQEPAGLLHFTRHLWIFDRDGLSDEDRRRTGFYHDQQRRKLALQHAPSLGEFLATLELRVDARPAPPGQIARIAQLSQRTNQFTATGVAVNQFDLQTAVRQGREVMAVEVSDRFGEYGMAGAVLYKKDTEALTVEAFYLSCRVLGRGVEHRILSELGCIAHRAGLEHIRIQWEESSRNQAFRRFLGQLPGRVEKPVGRPWTFILTTQQALEAKLIPADDAPSTAADPGSIHPNREVAVRSLAALARLPHELSSTGQILSRISLSASARREQRVSRVFTAPHDGLEGTIATEWCAILRLDRVGRNDNFFELGGNSLLLVQLNGNLISRLGLDITIPEMFEYPTVASLAIHLTGRTCADHSPETNSRAARSRAALQNRKRQLTVHRPQSQVNVGGGS